MGKSTWSGPIRTGRDTGAPSTTTIGVVAPTQFCTVTGNTSGAVNIVIPQGADIWDMRVVVYRESSAAGSAATSGLLIRIGNVTDEDYFGQIKVSSAGIYVAGGGALNLPTAVSAASWRDLAGDTRLSIDVTAAVAGSAGEGAANFDARLYVTYFQR